MPVAHAAAGASEDKVLSCSCHGHVEESAFLLQSAGVVGIHLIGEEILFQSSHTYGLEFKSLGGMYGHECYAVRICLRFVVILVGEQTYLLQVVGGSRWQSLLLTLLHKGVDGVGELLQVLLSCEILWSRTSEDISLEATLGEYPEHERGHIHSLAHLLSERLYERSKLCQPFGRCR